VLEHNTEACDFTLKVLSELNDNNEFKRNGHYVELGAYHWKDTSNTYALENLYNWRGLSLEIVNQFSEEFNKNRKNPCINEDACKFDYLSYFKRYDFPKQIDFLQIDIESTPGFDGRPSDSHPDLNLHALLALPLNTYRFTVITIEHMAMLGQYNEKLRETQRYILESLGYSLVVRYPHEDWWIDPKVIDFKKYQKYFSWTTNHFTKDIDWNGNK
jgi:hypothetical protein